MPVHAGIRHYRSNEEIYRREHYDGALEGPKIFAADSLLSRPGMYFVLRALMRPDLWKPHLSTLEEAMKTTLTAYRSAVGIVLATAFILMVPLVAMLFTDDVVWSLFDFIVVGVLLLGTGLAYELITRKVDKDYRVAVGLALAAALLLVWAELAVGVFGTPVAGS